MAPRKDLEAENHVNSMQELLEGTGVAGFQHSSPDEIRHEQMQGFPSKGRLFEADQQTKLDHLLGAAECVGRDQLHLAMAEIRYVLELDPEHSLAKKYACELNDLLKDGQPVEPLPEESNPRKSVLMTMLGLALATLSAVVWLAGKF